MYNQGGPLPLSSAQLCALIPTHLYLVMVSQSQLSRVVGLHSGSTASLDRTKVMGRGRI